MNLLDWFDITNEAHLQAYVHLSKTGFWPEGFLPEGIVLPNLWQVTLAGRMADAYLRLKGVLL